MNRATFERIEAFLRQHLKDSAHDRQHIDRVLYAALDIAACEPGVNMDILIAACLLHDVARDLEGSRQDVCHAQAGSVMAYDFLRSIGWSEADCAHVRDCIATHRYRSGNPPVSIEAKILFDADKLDAAGALGIARTLLYKGHYGQPLYTVDEHGHVEDGSGTRKPSLFHEYRFKLCKVYDGMLTDRGRQLATARRATAEAFYRDMLAEVRGCHEGGHALLAKLITD